MTEKNPPRHLPIPHRCCFIRHPQRHPATKSVWRSMRWHFSACNWSSDPRSPLPSPLPSPSPSLSACHLEESGFSLMYRLLRHRSASFPLPWQNSCHCLQESSYAYCHLPPSSVCDCDDCILPLYALYALPSCQVLGLLPFHFFSPWGRGP